MRSVDVLIALQTLREVREAALKREVEITEELAMKSEELCAAEKSRELLRLEVRDLKLALMSSDKELELAKSGASRDAVSSSAALAQTQAEVSDHHMSVYTYVCVHACICVCVCTHVWIRACVWLGMESPLWLFQSFCFLKTVFVCYACPCVAVRSHAWKESCQIIVKSTKWCLKTYNSSR